MRFIFNHLEFIYKTSVRPLVSIEGMTYSIQTFLVFNFEVLAIYTYEQKRFYFGYPESYSVRPSAFHKYMHHPYNVLNWLCNRVKVGMSSGYTYYHLCTFTCNRDDDSQVGWVYILKVDELYHHAVRVMTLVMVLLVYILHRSCYFQVFFSGISCAFRCAPVFVGGLPQTCLLMGNLGSLFDDSRVHYDYLYYLFISMIMIILLLDCGISSLFDLPECMYTRFLSYIELLYPYLISFISCSCI